MHDDGGYIYARAPLFRSTSGLGKPCDMRCYESLFRGGQEKEAMTELVKLKQGRLPKERCI